MRMNTTKAILAAALMAAGCSSARAGQTIVWGNEVGDVNTQSNGSSLWAADWTYALGAFTAGFIPSPENLNLWQANWTQFDEVTDYSLLDGYFHKESVLADNSVFAAGQQAYLWVYNDLAVSPPSEWFLLTDDSSDGVTTDNWTFPLVPAEGAQTLEPLRWEALLTENQNVVFRRRCRSRAAPLWRVLSRPSL
jgi:hypothetical protein